ncbi:hypothetical protein PPTG_24373 [Phytophthora nicotianae INRA-310]|uniref:Uncharacterized protein n=1 Tax=Phytophthora nicotianae (strain INRA-310) TaxID=761204 RepID=W2PIG8_PHYN3|nr:hypothetical protein PPTG_24373 [Phytophthora nicotianae INRA-310]ETM99804.1 hypothetical protein PPTG_24373 [Phytophthora nicotianae INRA-310]
MAVANKKVGIQLQSSKCLEALHFTEKSAKHKINNGIGIMVTCVLVILVLLLHRVSSFTYQ